MPNKPKTPKPPKPWDIRPKATRGSPTADDIYRAVGHALTTWEWVELELASVFALLVGAVEELTPPNEPAARAYGAILGFTSRAAMIDAATEGFFHLLSPKIKDPKVKKFADTVHTELKEIMKLANGLAVRRNDIAHGVHSGSDQDHVLVPPAYAVKKYPLTSTPTPVQQRTAFIYAAKDIEYYTKEFLSLAGKINEFLFNLRYLRGLLSSK